ncbi:MAG: hypothetical protein QM535_12405 [Limnohabitans sp.]|nr:hypothetical protein [Limnohabitans sp.]
MDFFFSYLLQQIGFYINGFALVVIILFLVGKLSNYKLIKTAYKVIPIIGLIHFVLLLFDYSNEFFCTYYSGNSYQQYAFRNRVTGPYCYAYFLLFFKTLLFTQLFRFEKIKGSNTIVALFSFLFLIPTEKIIILITSLHRDYLPSSWTLSTIDVIKTSIYSVFLFLLLTFVLHNRKEIFRKANNFINLKQKL